MLGKRSSPYDSDCRDDRRRARAARADGFRGRFIKGRLGFKRAILLRQAGIEDFTNVAGCKQSVAGADRANILDLRSLNERIMQ